MGDTLDNASGAGTSSTSPGDTNDTSAAGQYTNLEAAHIQAAQLSSQEDTGDNRDLLDTIGDLVTKAVPLTGAAVVNSFINTAAEVGNFLGGDFQKATISDEFGPDSDMTSYYNQHAGVIEGAALAAGSLLPGMGAIKALKLAQAGEFGTTFQRITGLASGIRDTAIKEATEDLVGNGTGQSLFGLTTLNKTKAILAGIADQALQGATYETATLATMHASPITDSNTLSDNISDVWDSAKAFGAFGGLIDGAINYNKINKALRGADLTTKEQQIFGSQGLANLTPGDRIVKLYEGLDKNAPATSRLSSLIANATSNTTGRQIQQQFIQAAGGDEEVAGAFRNFIETGRAAGTIGEEELTNNLSQLSSIGRHGDIGVVSTPQEVFYVPSQIGTREVATADTDRLLMKISSKTENTHLSRAFAIGNPSQLPVVGRATDTLSLSPLTSTSAGAVYPKYKGALDAYKQGVDIYVDAAGTTHINPDSILMKEVPRPGESRILTPTERKEYVTTGRLPTDSKPLNAVGLTLDLTSGKLFGEAPLPVVGDIAKPKLYGRGTGLQVGDTLFPQTAGADFNPASPLDANSRYVWAAMRGIKKGEAIASNDLPMLEQAYHEQVAGFDHEIDTFTDGSDFPQTSDEMLEHIRDVKQQMYSDLLAQGKDADEIGHILNAPTEGLTKNFNTTDPSELMIPTQQSANIKHIRLAYDIGTTRDQSGNLLRGMQATNYRVQLARTAASDTVSNYLAKFFGGISQSGRQTSDLFSALQFTKGAGDADILGAGSKFLANANAAYGTAAQQVERIGKTVGELNILRNSVVSDTLTPSVNAIRNDQAALNEYGNFVAVRQSTGEHYMLLSDADAAANKLPPNTAILEGAVTRDPKTGIATVNPSYIPEGFQPGGTVVGAGGVTSQGLRTYYTLSDKVANLERASQSLIAPRNQARSDWWKAQGVPKNPYPPERLYTPPIDTSRHPFFAYVMSKDGYALGESGASIITAKSAEELQTKIGNLGPSFSAFTKNDIAAFKRSQGEYDFDRNFQSNRVKTEMARKGILNNIVPETRSQNIIDNLTNWHFRQEAQLLRDHVELHNAAPFDQIKAMGDRFELTGTSRFGAITPFTQRTATNPYMSYVRTALGLSPTDNYPLWQLAQEKVESFFGTAFNQAKAAFGAVQKGLLPIEQAAKVSEQFGLGHPYGTTLEEMSKNYYGGLANQLPDQGVFRKFVATANTILGSTVIRLDTIQQVIHAVTLPIMVALEHSSATRDLANYLSVPLPGTVTPLAPGGQRVPGLMKTLYNGIKNYFQDDGTLASYYSRTGLTRDELQIHRQMINELSMPLGKLSESGWAQKIDRATQYAEKLTGSKFTNSFIHFLASDVGRQIGQAQGLGGQELLDTIGTFTNRVLGNVAAGQRAGIFSGPVGQAVGLFQSYQWNMMQQLLRHIGDSDVKALAMGAGMQSSIFGLSSLPGFQLVNNLIANRQGNTTGADLYSGTHQMFDNDTANYLLYGGLSGALGTSLYSRGDLNPRRASILPINPLQFPSVAAGMRVYQTLSQLENNVTTKGGDVSASLLLAAEHNGLSRPLTGLAELVQGFSTTANGDLISKTSGLSDLSSIATMSRILGARPLEEGVAMDALYRSNAVKVQETAKLAELGEVAKTALRGTNYFAPEVVQDFMADYVKAGGNQNNFNQWFLQQASKANTSTVNKVFNNFNSPRSKSLQVQMGGTMLPDYRNQPDIQDNSTASSDTQ